MLDDYRLSKYENEGEIRAGLRSALCLEGHGWHPSDHESEGLLATAFTKMGARRPTWLEGQPEYLVPSENCIRCGGELDDETMTRASRFCSETCLQAARIYREGLERYDRERVRCTAANVIAKATAPERRCQFCEGVFRTADKRQIFCSHACYEKAERNTARHKKCVRCDTAFVDRASSHRPQRYCSVECMSAERYATTERQCLVCEGTFQGKPKSKFCSSKCSNIWYRRRRLQQADDSLATSTVVLPLPTLSPAVFDREFGIAA